MNKTITVRTTPCIDGRIIQEIEGLDIHGLLMKQVLDTKEFQIREALIDLGWTPPSHDVR